MSKKDHGPDHPDHYEELEIDLREYIMLLWKKKWVIIGLILIAAVGAYFYTVMTTDVQHKATSDLLIMPPRHTELEISQMGQSTYANLAKSDDLLGRIIEELEMVNEEGELLNPADIEGRMELNILEDDELGGVGEGASFLMRMEVTDSDPQVASDIANTWAEIFRDDTLDIRRGEVEEIFDVTQRRLEETEENLDMAQEELQNLKEEARLDRLEERKDVYRDNLSQVESNLLSLQEELGEKESRRNRIDQEIADLEIEGVWQGELYSNLSQEQQQMESAENLLAAYGRLNAAEASFLRHEIAEIDELLEEEPDSFTLKKNLSEDELWRNIFNPEELEVMSELVLEEEILNPVYENLRQQRADTRLELNSFIDDSFYEGTEVSLDFAGENVSYEERIELLEQDVEHYNELYMQQADLYRDLRSENLELEQEIKRLNAEIDYYADRKEDLSSQIDQLEEDFWRYEREVKTAQREVDRYEESYERLTSQMEDARLAMAEQTSDVRFVSEAVPPGRTIGRGTTLNMAIAAVLAGMFGVFVVFFREFMKEEEEK